MGIAYQSLKWLHWLHRGGLKFQRVLTLGRLNFYPENEDPPYLAERFGFDKTHLDAWLKPRPVYSENVFKMFGATDVDSMDNSNYEKATIVHDMNRPVQSELHGQFDLVYDGGTLEHVFNFPEALRSAMLMVKPGGSIMFEQCFNNMAGHGFYCFGPEVFFRALSAENGFSIKNVRVYERYPRSPWYRFANPLSVSQRNRLISWGLEVQILVHATRIEDRPVFERWPQQGDYAAAWTDGSASFVTTRSDREVLGIDSTSRDGARATALKALRKHALLSPELGRLGKYWLNARNAGLQSKGSVFVLDDPLLGGGAPVH